MCIYYYGAFLWLKWCFLFGLNVYVFISMVLFYIKNVKMGFLFGVNVCVFIPMMLFY